MSKFLKNPVVILLSIIGGAAAGFWLRDFSSSIAIVGDVFLLMMKMCVLPILVASVVSSFGRLVSSKNKTASIVNILASFLCAFAVVGAIALAFVMVLRPGNLSIEDKKVFGMLLQRSEESYVEIASERFNSVDQVIKMVIPENIFKALANGESIQVLFFSALVGIAAGLLNTRGELVIKIADSFFAISISILNWIMLLLPFGLFSMIASQVAKTGLDIIMASARYITCIYYASISVIAVGAIAIALIKKERPHRVCYKLKDPLFVAFGTRSTLTSVPACIKTLHTDFKIPSDVISLIIPISSVLARFSMMILYVSATLFAVQLYGIDVTALQLLKIFGLCVVISVAGAGTPTAVSLSMLSIVFLPIGLPYSTIVILLLAITPIIDPILTTANVLTNCLITIIIDEMGKTRKQRA